MKKLLIIMLALLLFPVVSALTPLQELMSPEVTTMQIRITQNETFIDFTLDTNGTSFDAVTIWDDPYTWVDENNFTHTTTFGIKTYFSWLLNGRPNVFDGVNGKATMTKGTTFIEFANMRLGFGSHITEAINDKLNASGVSFTLGQINVDSNLLTEFTKRHPFPEWKFDSIFEKNKENYSLWMGIGFGDIPSEYENNVREIVESGFNRINPRKTIDILLPFNLSFSDVIDLSIFDFEIISISDFEIEDGFYEVVVEVQQGNDTAYKVIQVILDEIILEEEQVVEGIYIPTNPEIKKVIDRIEGLPNGTIINIKIFDKFETKPSNVDVKKYLEITTNIQTSATIYFTLENDEVDNPDNIRLYILENNWVELPTVLVSSGLEYIFKAEIPHFSTYVIGEKVVEEESQGDTGSGGSSRRSRRTTIIEPEVNITKTCNEWETRCFNDIKQQCLGNEWFDKEVCENGCLEGSCIIVLDEPEEKQSQFLKYIIIMGVLISLILLAWIFLRKEDEQKDYIKPK